MNIFAYSAHQQSNLIGTVNECFFYEKFKKLSSSVGSLIDEIKKVVSMMVDLEYQEYSTVRDILPYLVNQDSKSDARDKFHDFEEGTVCFK